MMKKIQSAYSIFFVLLTAFLFLGNAGGRPGNWAGAPGDSGTCAVCHTSSGAGAIQLMGAPSAYTAGQSYNMQVVLTQSAAVVGGFQLTATNGIDNALVGNFVETTEVGLNDVNRAVQKFAKGFSGGTVSWDVTWQAPSSGGPANVQFIFAGNAANGNMGNGAGDIGFNSFTPLIPLPVNLLTFDLEQEDEEIKINWTADEIENHSHFEVERSLDGNSFSPIGEVNSHRSHAGDSGQYSFVDENPEKGNVNYYRLKSIDFDGSYFYSKIRQVELESDLIAAVFPNPLNKGDQLHLEINNFQSNRNYEIRVIDSNAKVVKIQSLNAAESLVEVNEMGPGLYAIQLLRDGVPVWIERTILL